jgi:hypothetical membrane protein
MKKTEIGAVLWIFCLQYFLAEAVAISAWPGHYSLSANYISDLGALRCGAQAQGLAGATERLCSPLHAVMNASFGLQGLLIIGGAILTAPLFPKGWSWKIALLLIGASGLGVFVVGLAPEDAAPAPHYFGAVENFLCCNAGLVVTGVALQRWRGQTRGIGALTLAAGSLGLLGVALLAAKTYLGFGVGGMERIAAYPFPLAIATLGGFLLRRGELTDAGPAAPPGKSRTIAASLARP